MGRRQWGVRGLATGSYPMGCGIRFMASRRVRWLGSVRLPGRAVARHSRLVPRRFPRLRGIVLFRPVARRGAPGLTN